MIDHGRELDQRAGISAAQFRQELPWVHIDLCLPASASGLYSQGEAAALRAVNSAQQPPSQGRAGLSNTTDGSQVDRSGTNIYNNKTSRKAG